MFPFGPLASYLCFGFSQNNLIHYILLAFPFTLLKSAARTPKRGGIGKSGKSLGLPWVAHPDCGAVFAINNAIMPSFRLYFPPPSEPKPKNQRTKNARAVREGGEGLRRRLGVAKSSAHPDYGTDH